MNNVLTPKTNKNILTDLNKLSQSKIEEYFYDSIGMDLDIFKYTSSLVKRIDQKDIAEQLNVNEIIHLIKIGRLNPKIRLEDGNTFFHHLCCDDGTYLYDNMSEFKKIIDLLIKNGLNINTKNLYGYTPLMYLIDFSHSDNKLFDKFLYLVSKNASLSMKNKKDKNALDICIEHILSNITYDQQILFSEINSDLQKFRIFAYLEKKVKPNKLKTNIDFLKNMHEVYKKLNTLLKNKV